MTKIALLVPDPDYEEHWQPVAERYEALLGTDMSGMTLADSMRLI